MDDQSGVFKYLSSFMLLEWLKWSKVPNLNRYRHHQNELIDTFYFAVDFKKPLYYSFKVTERMVVEKVSSLHPAIFRSRVWGPYLAVSFHSISCPSTDRSSSNSVKSCGGAGPSSSSPRMKRILSAAGETAEIGKILRFIGWQWCPLGRGLDAGFSSSAGPFQLTSGGGGGGGIFTMTSNFPCSPFSSESSSFSSWLLLLLDIFEISVTPPLLSKSADQEFAPLIAVGKRHKLTESQSRS